MSESVIAKYNCANCKDTGWVERDPTGPREAKTQQKELCYCRKAREIMQDHREQKHKYGKLLKGRSKIIKK